MDISFCLEALDEALDQYSKPEIFNTDQGSQFTSGAFTDRLKQAGIAISMDGKGRWVDNVSVERFWRSSVVTLNPAIGGQFKTGHSERL